MKRKTKVLYAGQNLRVRRRETILNPPEEVEYLTQYDITSMKKDTDLSFVKEDVRLIQ